MKIIHISDLHIGKIMYGISMLDNGDQPSWIRDFILLVKKEKPRAILISGDVYDRSNPSREAIEAVDNFLTMLSELDFKPAVFMIAGNHDSGSLVEYLRAIAEKQNIYVAGLAEKEIRNVTLEDEYGSVDFWLIPYVFPAAINKLLGTEYRNYDEAFRAYLEYQNIDFRKRNVIISHQNILFSGKEAERGGSESMVGGVGGIEFSVFDGFEYAALGHIHAAQSVGRPGVRYAGSPLCYHFDELKRPKKGPVIVELGEKGKEPEIRIEEIKPLHALREIRGSFREIIENERENFAGNEYIKLILKPDSKGSHGLHYNGDDQLRQLFASKASLVLDIEYEYANRKISGSEDCGRVCTEEKTLTENFSEFWNFKRGEPLEGDLLELAEFIAEKALNSEYIPSAGSDKISPAEAKDLSEIIEFALKEEENI